MSTEVRVPTLGESVTEATVATWFKKPGDPVAADDPLCELETDKVTVEVPAPSAGTLGDIVAAEGETVGVDALLATISEGDGAGAETKAEGGSGNAEGGVAAAEGKEKVQAEDAGYEELAAKEEPSATETERAGYAEEIRAKRDDKKGGDAKGGSEGGGGGRVEVTVPTLGESVTEATVSTWFKKVGDAVEADEPLCELETDKVSVEVPSPAAGTLSEILAEEGATVEASAKIAVLTEGGSDAGAGKSSAPDTETVPAKPDATGGEPDQPATDYGRSDAAEAPKGGREGSGRSDVEDAPSAKALMAEKGVERGRVEGTGRDGRIMKADVLRALEAPREAPEAEGGAARAGRRRGRGPRGAGEDDPPAPDHRAQAQGRAEHRRDADHLQRGGHDRGHGAALGVQGAVRAQARRQAGLHELLHQGVLPRADGGARGQRRDRRRRRRLQALRAHGDRGGHAQRPRGAGGARRRRDGLRRDREGDQRDGPQGARRQARRWPTCRAAPSPSRTAASTAR